MDARRLRLPVRVAVRCGLAGFLPGLLALVGCVPPSAPLTSPTAQKPPTPPAALTPPSPPTPVVEPKVEADDAVLPKRQPHAGTCVAFGDFNLRAAGDAGHTALQREGLLDQARRAYQQALKIDPNCREAHAGLARAYEQAGDHARAVEAYQGALKVFPKDASFWFDLGMCQARAKEWDKALDAMNTALSFDPENRTYANMVAYTLARAGRYDQSVAAFQRLVGPAQAHYNVARMLHHVHQDALCREHLNLALRAQADFKPAAQLLAEIDHPGGPHTAAAVGFETLDDAPPPMNQSAPRSGR